MKKIMNTFLSFAIIFCCMLEKVYALPDTTNHIQVTGEVTDEEDEPLPNASVQIEGKSIAVSTNINGEYIINIPRNISEPKLRFSFLGFETQIVLVGTQRSIKISLRFLFEAEE